MLNLQEPMQGRRWLRLLDEDPRCGFRLRPNLDVPSRELGFSLRSNAFGLRGPCDIMASNVVLGTSFAMGMAVNNGENWYEHCLPNAGWLNLGLAVGIREWTELISIHHCGPRDLIVLLYHPNIWTHCLMYERWRTSGVGLFRALRWRTGWLHCMLLSLRKSLAQQRGFNNGNWVRVMRGSSQRYEIDARYSLVPPSDIAGVFDRNIGNLVDLLAGFRRVIVVRLRVKQELVPTEMCSPQLRVLCRQYDCLWASTVSALKELNSVECHVPEIFGFESFHYRDTHWNAAGNRVFADWFRESIL